MLKNRAVLTIVLSIAAPLAHASPTYKLTGIGFLDPINGFASFATAINASGTVTGYSDVYDSSGNFQGIRAFTYQSGQMTNLGTPPTGASSDVFGGSQGLAINASGQVAGVFSYYEDANNPTTRTGDGAFLSNNGLTTVGDRSDVNDPTLIATAALAINDAGTIAGSYRDHAFYQTPGGTPTELPSLLDDPAAPWSSVANGINSNGALTGQADVGCGCSQFAFIYVNGIMTSLGSVGASDFSEGLAINDQLQIAGDYQDEFGDYQAALFDQGLITTIGPLPGATDTSALALNNGGLVVGRSDNSAFLFDLATGTTQDLNDLIDPTLGWHLIAATGINDAGQITGFGFDPDGAIQGFILDTPEPGTFFVLGAGLLGLFLYKRPSSC